MRDGAEDATGPARHASVVVGRGCGREPSGRRVVTTVSTRFLPVCAWCGKVRDDTGYWLHVDASLPAYTEVHPTHGICPDCQERLLAEARKHRGRKGRGSPR